MVQEKEYRNLRLEQEDVAEIGYRAARCRRFYRLVILRKRITVEEGQQRLWEDVRYLFYITNIEEMTPAEVVLFSNGRCNQENLIEQLKNGLNALRMPVGDLVSNWAYMVMASLAWTLNAWFALLVRRAESREQLLRMEFAGHRASARADRSRRQAYRVPHLDLHPVDQDASVDLLHHTPASAGVRTRPGTGSGKKPRGAVCRKTAPRAVRRDENDPRHNERCRS